MSFTFVNQMEENTNFFMKYPFHVDKDALLNCSPSLCRETDETQSFARLLQKAYNEPFAIYLTEDDMKYYSEQELTLFDKVVARERELVNQGMCIIDLELSEETLDMLLDYKNQTRMTFEEAIIHIIKQFLDAQERK